MSGFEKTKRAVRKGVVGVFGGVILVAGLIMIPYPGPGWLVVFIGLAILATEFKTAQRILNYTKKRYDAWEGWLRQQSRVVQLFFWLLTCMVVIVTIWLFNGYGIINHWLELDQDWLNSPFIH